MDLVRVGPVREAGHDIELAEQLGDDRFGVGIGGEPVDFGDDLQQDRFDARDRLLTEILALLLQALMMFDEFFAVKLCERGDGRDGQATLKSVPSRRHEQNTSSV